ncbi:SusD/RagB family nutrient-binding outer membrane lipoprotein [Pedobacter punctiformis]|uniref:SusD/RagB family nutrient-binding outer membrane lipoprotein n=1 Tax=Pedobacter punctiformis TaxID=3004097 RepID=A0ABT4L649_9SPHI|nr:SusD/RagB family nutrient-binding outer membrane lipoprotein [Pedobacter sp. HCMS5-2]MCZ4243402.1 SusD/RagB family nutrient-binding outer membrane lipoprotein [Pedobacter sp. HCMS5-2]
MKKKLIYLFTASAILLGACKKGYLDINTNPNNATSAKPALILTGALNNTAASTTGHSIFYSFAALWMNYWMTPGGVSGWYEERSYNFTTNWSGSTTLWANVYDNLTDYTYLETQGKASGQNFFVAVAKTMKAWDYQYLVDFYGNVPYSQASQSVKFLTPKYDKGQEIYEDLAKQLDTAANLFKTASVAPGDASADIFAKGNVQKWGKFANTLKLRILLRQSQMPGREAYIKAEIAKINANGMGYIGTGDGIFNNPGYLNTDGKQNPFWGVYGYKVDGTRTASHGYMLASTYGMDFLKNNADPRLAKMYNTVNDNAGSTYVSLQWGQDVNFDQTIQTVSSIGEGVLKSYDQPQPIITDFESLFIQAEAAQRGWIAGDAKAYYEAAVKANFVYLGLTEAEAITYLADQAVAKWDTNSDKMALIIKQKWAAMNGTNDIEPWSDYRRLELPADMPISIASTVTTKKIPVRMLYPQREYNTNSANVIAEGTINQFTSRIFWDVQ